MSSRTTDLSALAISLNGPISRPFLPGWMKSRQPIKQSKCASLPIELWHKILRAATDFPETFDTSCIPHREADLDANAPACFNLVYDRPKISMLLPLCRVWYDICYPFAFEIIDIQVGPNFIASLDHPLVPRDGAPSPFRYTRSLRVYFPERSDAAAVFNATTRIFAECANLRVRSQESYDTVPESAVTALLRHCGPSLRSIYLGECVDFPRGSPRLLATEAPLIKRFVTDEILLDEDEDEGDMDDEMKPEDAVVFPFLHTLGLVLQAIPTRPEWHLPSL
jgi:hypothetical protein